MLVDGHADLSSWCSRLEIVVDFKLIGSSPYYVSTTSLTYTIKS